MRESVSAIFSCGEKIYLTLRQNYLRVFPGYHAFPGGKVDAVDSLTKFMGHEFIENKDIKPYWLNTLKREMQEELSIDLSHWLKNDEIIKLSRIACAITPEFNPYRFANQYFLIELKTEYAFELDANEACAGKWMTPAEALEAYDRVEALMVPPMVSLLKALVKNKNWHQFIDISYNYDASREIPMIESLKGVKQFLPLSNTFPPAKRTNCFLIGEVLIDPSPANIEEFNKLLFSLSKHKIKSVFITHHHPDHHEFLPQLIEHLKCEVGMSALCEKFISKRCGSDYLKDLKLKHYVDGDILCTDARGEKIKLMSVPGHDASQLALYPQSMSWFLAGDLIQGVGTVVVGGYEGNMSDYFNSLEKIIKLNPLFTIPSHGIIMGGVHKLQETLDHRKKRENEIRHFLEQGLDMQQICDEIYSKLADNLRPYALKTLKSHIIKIEQE